MAASPQALKNVWALSLTWAGGCAASPAMDMEPLSAQATRSGAR